MKRSEFAEKLEEELEKSHSYAFYYVSKEEILDAVEKLGMLPPEYELYKPIYKSFIMPLTETGKYTKELVNEWEEEDKDESGS
jgi:hypothetical protein